MIACTQESMSLAEAHAWRMMANQVIVERDRAIDRAEKAEDTLSATRAELDRCLMLAVQDRKMNSELEAKIDMFLRRELGSAAEEKDRADGWWKRAERAEEELAAMRVPCVWRVEAPAHFVGHLDDKPLEMMLMATSCGKELGVQLTPSYCAYCGHPIEVK